MAVGRSRRGCRSSSAMYTSLLKGLKVEGLGVRVEGLGSRVQGSFGVQGLRSRFKVQGIRVRG